MTIRKIIIFYGFSLAAGFCGNAIGAPPTPRDVDVYASLCKIGSQTSVAISGELGVISRRLMAGDAKLSASKLQDEFPGTRDEKIRLAAILSVQDCMYRYVERFHLAANSSSTGSGPSASIIDPGVPVERRREIVFLANELESFKLKMSKAISMIPTTFYDKRDSTERKPKDDPRLIGLADFSRYKAFQSASGGLDFSNATNNDLALLCSTYTDEINAYKAILRQYPPLGLPAYAPTGEAARICTSAIRGRK